MCARPSRSLLPRWLTSALLIVALVVAGQGMHLAGGHHDDMQAGGAEIAAAMQHGGGEPDAIADCSDSLCSLCVTLVSGGTDPLPRATRHRRSPTAGAVLATPLERLYRPPIVPA